MGATDRMQGKTDNKSEASRLVEVGLLLYPQAQLAAIHGLTDLFAVADRLARDRLGAAGPLLRVSHLSRNDTDGNVSRIFDTHPGASGDPVVIVLPPSLADPLTADSMAGLAGWLRERHAMGITLTSICSGAFLLAETGLLAGRAVTTHRIYAEHLSRRYPDLQVQSDRSLIDHGDIVSASGLMAWTDLGLMLVDRLLGPCAMIETARFMLVDPPGREPRFHDSFSPELAHGDGAVLKVQQWLQRVGTRSVTIATMAAQAGLEERTFLRRFRKATSLKPTEYCQHLRVAEARELLEATAQPVDQIAWSVGYDDPGSFRKVFVKITGVGPGDYRRRFRTERACAGPLKPGEERVPRPHSCD
jgi:transcriptional regulator GlxA family with amidase domain